MAKEGKFAFGKENSVALFQTLFAEYTSLLVGAHFITVTARAGLLLSNTLTSVIFEYKGADDI